jgi:hypothetical protein
LGRTASAADESSDRLKYLAALAGFEQRMPLAAPPSRSVAWRGHEALDAEAEEFRQEIGQRYSVLVGMLLKANVLTEEEAFSLRPPRINLQIWDCRSPGCRSMPEVRVEPESDGPREPLP